MRGLTLTFVGTGVLASLAIATPASATPTRLAAQTCAGKNIQPVTVSKASALNGIAVISACHAWAAGDSWNGSLYQTLVERWNGTAWHVVPSPDPAGTSTSTTLVAVAAHSPSDAWAVGGYGVVQGDLGFPRSFIVRWNGTAWSTIRSPQPGFGSVLNATTADPAGSGWAVGYYLAGKFGPGRSLIEHWNGKSWIKVPSPNAGGAAASDELFGVTATSPKDAWAVGTYVSATLSSRTLIEHWNGVKWQLVSSPNFKGVNISGPNELTSVTATSPSSAWAVGDYLWAKPDSYQGLILHWNGKVWKRAAAGPIVTDSQLYSVTSLRDGQAWAVGWCDDGPGTPRQWLIWHLSGKTWQSAISPHRTTNYMLTFVGATSPTNVWALALLIHPGLAGVVRLT